MAAINPKFTQAAQQYTSKKAPAKAVKAEAPVDSKGKKLDSSIKKQMEETMGKKLGDVQIHTDAKSKDSAKQIGAKAYTFGKHIYFASPKDAKDEKLLAHCLAHVVQQGGKSQKGKVNKIK